MSKFNESEPLFILIVDECVADPDVCAERRVKPVFIAVDEFGNLVARTFCSFCNLGSILSDFKDTSQGHRTFDADTFVQILMF